MSDRPTGIDFEAVRRRQSVPPVLRGREKNPRQLAGVFSVLFTQAEPEGGSLGLHADAGVQADRLGIHVAVGQQLNSQ